MNTVKIELAKLDYGKVVLRQQWEKLQEEVFELGNALRMTKYTDEQRIEEAFDVIQAAFGVLVKLGLGKSVTLKIENQRHLEKMDGKKIGCG